MYNSVIKKQLKKWAKDLSWGLFMKDVQVVKRHLKSCSTSIRKSKSDLHYYVTSMDATKSQIWTGGDMETQYPSSLLVGCKCLSHLENTFTLLKNVKHSVAIWSIIPVLLQSIKAKSYAHVKTCTRISQQHYS